MLFYICLFIITVSLVLFTRKKVFTVMAFVILGATYALRDVLAVDDILYIQAFEYINSGWYYDIEITYRWLSQGMYQMGLNYKAIFFIYGTLSIFFLYKGVNIICDNNFQKALFLATFFAVIFITSMSVMRQFLAGCIIFYTIISYIKEKKLLKTWVLLILSSFVHYSSGLAVVAFLFLFLKKRIPDIMKIILPILCLIIGYLNIPGSIIGGLSSFLPESYSHYSDALVGNYSTAGGTMHYVLLIMFIGQFVLRKQSVAADEKTSFLELGQMIYLCLNFLLAQAGVASRLSFMFMPFIASLPYTFIKNFNLNDRKIIGVTCIACMFTMFVYSINGFVASNSEFFIPYKGSLNFFGDK